MNSCSFNLPGLRQIHDYLPNRKQTVKIENAYSTWMEIVFGVPQGLMLRLSFFNIFLVDLFFIINNTDIASDADYNVPDIVADNTDDLIKSLEKAPAALFQCFENDLLKTTLARVIY